MSADALPPALDALPPRDDEGRWLAVIEATQGSRHKTKYEAKWRAFTLSRTLPQGMAFPYDFGFVPSTLGDDGDPLDVLVLCDAPLPLGTVVPCRVIGVIEAEQQEGRGRPERNDRILAVAEASHRHRRVRTLKDLSADLLDEIESFFVDDHRLQGRRFTPLARRGPEAARALLRAGERRAAEGG